MELKIELKIICALWRMIGSGDIKLYRRDQMLSILSPRSNAFYFIAAIKCFLFYRRDLKLFILSPRSKAFYFIAAI
jgi:hypothetical protein